ncbi:DNA recombination protein RmuC [Nocardia blacklockiae]|uniref:DNA recombination protein RmuC n=1 Tax=Nocardia blacklockiae TaxID=480036 RepID=UPI001895C75C|nr:DNA recombination protein RmuC [Nocardia blacklockiae]MBF6171089.1 DNA recombination protein RmuC [Nocardia blacklockiae]
MTEVLTQSGTQLIQRFTEMTQVSAQATAGEMDQRKAAFDAMVVPLREELDKLHTQVRTFQETGAGAFSAVTEQMKATNYTNEQLRKQTEQLVTALRKPNTRGQWGELQLRTVVEAAGMIEHVDFQQQVHVVDADGALRPDMVVNLGGGRTIVVDAKAPFGAFLEAQEADTDAARAERAAAHARNVRRHVEQLAAKQYWAQFSCTPEFVVMFLPAEAFLQAALDHDPGLWDDAIRKKVILTTPTNLLMALRTVAYMWQQQALAENADRIDKLGSDLYQRITNFIVHLNTVGATLGKTVEAYDKTIRSFNSRLLPGARKMAELRRAEETLEDLPTLERTVPTSAFPSAVGAGTDGGSETDGGARTA